MITPRNSALYSILGNWHDAFRRPPAGPPPTSLFYTLKFNFFFCSTQDLWAICRVHCGHFADSKKTHMKF